MSDQLPTPDFDSQHYERPNQKWICGHAGEGKPCRLGPTNGGRCQAGSECVPVLETKPGESKGRWRCTRAGGACENGPLPDGKCCHPISRCSPIPTLRTRRAKLTRWVVATTIAGLLVALGGPWRTLLINPGKLSTAHSGDAFKKLSKSGGQPDENCGACHTAGNSGPSGIITAAFHSSPGPFEIERLSHLKKGEATTLDQSCQKCHTSHVLHQAKLMSPASCSFCHQEHQGGGRMATPTDANCGLCHGSPEKMGQLIFASTRKSSENQGIGVARNFAGDHPEFRLHVEKKRDPNTLKFNHALHLTSETIPKLKKGEKLDCRFCHQADVAGRFFRGIKFESHCQVCHSLQFDPETPSLTLPHGNPGFVSAFLHSLPKQYTDFAARSGLTSAPEQNRFVQERLERLRGRIGTGEDFEKRVFFSTAMIGGETQVGAVRGVTPALYPGCAYCHEVKADKDGQAGITPPIMTERWLTGAEFTHAKHSGVACSQCHQAEKSKATSDILLPLKQVCATCHSRSGGVADSCATCHVYHTKRIEAVQR